MTQPSTQPTPPPAAPAPTNTPPANTAPAHPGQAPAAPPTPPWPAQATPGYPVPQAPPVQYVPVMPIPQTVAAPAANDGGQTSGDTDLSKLPQWAQKQIGDLRDENAKRRVSERAAVVNQHAWMAAQQVGANAQAVLGSLAWQQAADGLDPTSPDFGRHLVEAIQRTVQANPWMGAQPTYPPAVPGQLPLPGQSAQGQPPAGAPAGPPAPGQPIAPSTWPQYPGIPPTGYPQPGWPGYPPQPPAAPPTSGAEFAGGNGAGGPITEAQLAQMTPEQITEAFTAGKLKHLL
jgi:hypothetical protein